MNYSRNDCSMSSKLVQAVEDGLLTWEDIGREALSEMSEDDISEMCRLTGWDDLIKGEDEDEDDDITDIDEN